ncbi:hypothetical protein [Burkholderia arboris]|nr:hypothetical protein [Burkholderia arboris]
MQEFLNTTSIPTEESFQSFTRSAIDLSMIWAVLSTHKKYQKLPRDIRVAFFKDPINPINNINSAGRDKLFEYYVGARFNAAGCSIRYDEPDVICNYKNIEFGVAAKRFRVENLQQHIKKARNQIEKSGLPGVIALDVTPSSPFTEHPYFETPDHFRHAADKWLFDVFHSQVNKYGDQWKLDGIKTPIIICFLQSIFAIEDGTLAFFAKKYILNINPKREPSKTEAIQIRIIQEAVESLRRTLPEADHAT